MLKNYFKIALRNIIRNKVFSFINIVGLSIGIAVSFCIFVFIIYELIYDRHHKNYNHIYRVESQWKDVDFRVPMTSVPLAESIKREIPGIKEFVRFYHKSSLEFVYNNSSFKIDYNYFVDPSIFDVFTYSFLAGDAKAFSSRRNSIILSNSTALKIFGSTDILGKVISLKYKSSNVDVEIVGIIEDESLPASITPEIIIPFGLLQKLDPYFSNDDWVQLQRVVTFLLLEDAIDVKELARKIKKLNALKSANNPNYIMDVNFYVVPLKETYFVNDRDLVPSYIPVVNKDKIIIYSVIGISILLMACINFVLLTSAKASIRYLEIGVRKVLGAEKRDIVQQIILESVLTLMLTLPLTVVFIELIFPYFQDVINIQIKPSFYTGLVYIVGLITLNVFIGIASGSYISFLLLRMKPIDILTRKLSPNFSNLNFRRILLLFQIVVFITLLISTIILKYQMQYIYNKDLAFDNRNAVVIKCREIEGREEVFKNLVV
ncbi:MAG: ABC transporter permease [Ignavibacteriae bacterium]|nr:ABC transporter permease [Ignavibacteriota bacterium]